MEPRYDITDEVKRDVLAATDLVSLIGAATSLKKAGTSWKGLCPFHGEKTPSFHVHPTKGFYYCFGCGAKGDAISFVQQTERLDFVESVAYLARLAGVTLPVRRGGTRADRAKDVRAVEALVQAARFYRDHLERHAAASALVKKRGLTLDGARELGIGAAPDSWDALKEDLAPSFPEETLIEAGLLQRSLETGRLYDRFRNRLTIEIRDARGELLGFGARALGDDSPKYLNSPETPRFSKGKLLYGLDRARDAIRKSDLVILVEGYFDRIALERAGLPNAVASMGTALTPVQADLLCRQAGTVVVAYDGDPPGQAAALKAFGLLVARGARVRHLVLPDGHDPDSFLAEHGAEALVSRVSAAESLVGSLASRVPPAGGTSAPEERASRASEAMEILSQAPDRILRHELVTAFGRAAQLPPAVLRGAGKKPAVPAVTESPGAPAERLPESEETVLKVLLEKWPETAELASRLPRDLLSHPVSREILSTLKEMDCSRTLDFSRLESHLGGAAGLALARLLLEGPAEEPRSGRADHKENRGADGPSPLLRLHKPLLQMKIRQLESKSSELSTEIASAEGLGDVARKAQLLAEKQSLSAEIHRLKKELRRPDERA